MSDLCKTRRRVPDTFVHISPAAAAMRTLVVLLLVLAASPSRGQTAALTPEQQAVWTVVEAYNTAYAQRDIDGFMRHVHPRFVGWDGEALHPDGAAAMRAFLGAWLALPWRSAATSVHPASVEVFGDAAVVHYHFTMMVLSDSGSPRTMRERWTDTLVREGGRWQLAGSSGGTVRLSSGS